MKRLEALYRVALFDRTQKVPQLNPLAHALLPKVRKVVHDYETLLDDFTDDDEIHGELTLGAVPSTIRALVPLSVRELVHVYPQLRIRVVPGLSNDMQAQVERGAVDCAILSEPGVLGPHVRWVPFVSEELVLLTSPDIRVRDPLRLLRSKPYIRHTRRAAVGLLADQWLKDHGVEVHESMEMESIESLTSMVSHNLGVSIVPDVCVPDVIFANLRKLRLPAPRQSRVLGVLCRADSSKMRIVERLTDQLQETVKQHSRSARRRAKK